MKGTRRLALIAALSAVALTIFVAESQIPPLTMVPGMKLGLANIVTLVAMVILNRRDAGVILAIRLVLGSIFGGGISAFMFSAAGGLLLSAQPWLGTATGATVILVACVWFALSTGIAAWRGERRD